MEKTVSLALKIVKMEAIESDHMEAQSKRDTFERISARFSAQSETGKKARTAFKEWTDNVIALRKQLAQAIFNTYGKGVDGAGNIIWKD